MMKLLKSLGITVGIAIASSLIIAGIVATKGLIAVPVVFIACWYLIYTNMK